MFDEFKYAEPDPNKKPAAEIWNARYAAESYLYGKEPVLGLRNHVGALRKGAVLDVAMGEGRNAVFLAQNGFSVQGVDCSSAAIEKAKRLAADRNVEIDAKTQNLDFFLMPLMKFDSILMTYFKPSTRFFSEVRRGLVQGGTFFLEAYTVDQIKHSPLPNLEFEECFKPGEVLHHLKEFQVLFYKELPDGNAHTVQAIAKKVSR